MVHASTALHIVHHPMVDYLNSLRTQERGANPTYVHENRAAFLDALRTEHDWFPAETDLQIATKLDDLVQHLASAEPRFNVVFLTGDAGDGKTATCAALARALGFEGELDDETVCGGWIILKDASELPPDRLEVLLRTHHLEREPNSSTRLLVAINEGRLRRVAERIYKPGDPFRATVLDPALDPELSADAAEKLDRATTTQQVLVLNFRHRASVRAAVPALLRMWTRPPLWEDSKACSGCPARSHCPILANATDLRSTAVHDRVGDLLMTAVLSGQRLPLRRLQAVLALTVTGGLSCRDVLEGPLANGAGALDRLRYRYYDAIFRSDARGVVPVQPEAVCLALSPVDPGKSSDRYFDEQIALRVRETAGAGQPLASLTFGPIELAAFDAVVPQGEPDEPVDALSDRLAKLTRSLRRWRSLVDPEPGDDVQRWLRTVSLIESYVSDESGEELRKAVVDALNRLHLVEGIKTDRITRRQIDAAGFREPVRRALELDLQSDFVVRLEKTPNLPGCNVAPWLEHGASDVFLCASHPSAPERDARLLLDARLVHALLGVKAGFQQLGAFGAYRLDLARFFSHLVQLAVDAGAQPRLSVLVGGVRFRIGSQQGKLDLQAES